MVEVEEKSQGVEDLVKKYNHKAHIFSRPNYFIIPPFVLVYQLFNFLAATPVQTTSTNYQLVDKKVDHFTEMMKSLVLLVRTSQINTGLFVAENIQSQLPPTISTNSIQPNNPSTSF